MTLSSTAWLQLPHKRYYVGFRFFGIEYVLSRSVSCERIITKHVTRVLLFGVSFFSRVYVKLDFSLSILCFLEMRV